MPLKILAKILYYTENETECGITFSSKKKDDLIDLIVFGSERSQRNAIFVCLSLCPNKILSI